MKANVIFLGRHVRHLFVTGFINFTFTTVFTITGIILQSSYLQSLSKRFSSRACLRLGGENEENKGIYSCPAKVISNAILFVYSLRGVLAKTSRVSLHEMAQFVLKIVHLTTFVFRWKQPHYSGTQFKEKPRD